MPKTAFIIIADGELDQIAEDRASANREKRDLKAMGCTVKVLACPWEKQDAYIEDLIERGQI